MSIKRIQTPKYQIDAYHVLARPGFNTIVTPTLQSDPYPLETTDLELLGDAGRVIYSTTIKCIETYDSLNDVPQIVIVSNYAFRTFNELFHALGKESYGFTSNNTPVTIIGFDFNPQSSAYNP